MKLVCTLHSFTPKVTLVERFLEMFMSAYQLLCFNSHMSWYIFIVSLSLSLSLSVENLCYSSDEFPCAVTLRLKEVPVI